MNTSIKRKVAALLALALGTTALCGCNQEVPVTLDTPSPWHDGSNSYERLVYDVTIYNGTGGELCRPSEIEPHLVVIIGT